MGELVWVTLDPSHAFYLTTGAPGAAARAGSLLAWQLSPSIALGVRVRSSGYVEPRVWPGLTRIPAAGAKQRRQRNSALRIQRPVGFGVTPAWRPWARALSPLRGLALVDWVAELDGRKVRRGGVERSGDLLDDEARNVKKRRADPEEAGNQEQAAQRKGKREGVRMLSTRA